MESNKSPIKIVSFDGGGLRGWGPSYVLSKIKEELNEFDPGTYFDVFSGTSTGAIISLSLVMGVPLTEILDNYEMGQKNFFSQKNSKKQFIQKPIFPRFNNDVFTEFSSKYIHEDETLRDLWDKTGKTIILYATNFTNGSPLIFATPNIKGDYVAGADYKIIDIFKAVIGAPGYFELTKMKVDGKNVLVGDGGLWANNPSSFTVKNSKEYYGNDREMHLISFGNEYWERILFHDEYNQLKIISLTQDLIKVVTRSQMKYSSKMTNFLADRSLRFIIKQDEDSHLSSLTDSYKEAVKKSYYMDRQEIIDFIKDK